MNVQETEMLTPVAPQYVLGD